MPWANGRGTTSEIAIHPADAGIDSFHWRVSLASMVEDAPFSILAGVDRTLAVVDGHGIELTVGTLRPHRLRRSGDPFSFPGDVPAFARLVSGPVSNLNVMTRRGHGVHRVERLRVERTIELSTTGLTIIHAVDSLTVDDLTLTSGETVIISGSPVRVHLRRQTGDAIVIRLDVARNRGNH